MEHVTVLQQIKEFNECVADPVRLACCAVDSDSFPALRENKDETVRLKNALLRVTVEKDAVKTHHLHGNYQKEETASISSLKTSPPDSKAKI